MANRIVTVNVSQIVAPTPNNLQSIGAIISTGGTNFTTGSLNLITQLSTLTANLSAAKAISAMSWSASVVTVTTSSAHGWTVGDVIPVVITGVVPAGYNGTVTATVTTTTQFTYSLASNPGSVTTQGTVVLGDEAELLLQGTTFFAQGSGQAVYVLELGESTVNNAVAALTTYLTNNPNSIYSFLVPREWDNNTAFLALLASYEATTAKTYFFITTTTGTYTNYTALMKCAFTVIQAPGTTYTEFTAAAMWWVTLNYSPSSTNKVPPLSFAYVYGVTPYPTVGNSTLFAQLKAASVNIVGTGAEGGISNAIIFWGTTMDGNPWNYWYAVDYAQINLDLFLANAVINGSNTTINPLYYDQNGINTLQDVATQVLGNMVTYGLLIGTVAQTNLPIATFLQNYNAGAYLGLLVINAEPFLTYTTENPTNYAQGTYGGLAAVITPARGFTQIVFNLTATNFI